MGRTWVQWLCGDGAIIAAVSSTEVQPITQKMTAEQAIEVLSDPSLVYRVDRQITIDGIGSVNLVLSKDQSGKVEEIKTALSLLIRVHGKTGMRDGTTEFSFSETAAVELKLWGVKGLPDRTAAVRAAGYVIRDGKCVYNRRISIVNGPG